MWVHKFSLGALLCLIGRLGIVAIFYPFSQFCEIDISLPSLQKQPKHSRKSISEGGRIWQVCDLNRANTEKEEGGLAFPRPGRRARLPRALGGRRPRTARPRSARGPIYIYIYMYIYIYTYIYVYIYTHIYIYIERERDR